MTKRSISLVIGAVAVSLIGGPAAAQPAMHTHLVPPPVQRAAVQSVRGWADSQHQMMLDDLRRHIGMNGDWYSAVEFERRLERERAEGRYREPIDRAASLYRTGLPPVFSDFVAGP